MRKYTQHLSNLKYNQILEHLIFFSLFHQFQNVCSYLSNRGISICVINMHIEPVNLSQLIPGNVNTYTPRKSTLEAPFVASKVRFFPYAAHPRTACMRVEVYGCRWKRRYNKRKMI